MPLGNQEEERGEVGVPKKSLDAFDDVTEEDLECFAGHYNLVTLKAGPGGGQLVDDLVERRLQFRPLEDLLQGYEERRRLRDGERTTDFSMTRGFGSGNSMMREKSASVSGWLFESDLGRNP